MINNFYNPIKELLKGLLTVLENGLKPSVTLEYPEQQKTLNKNFRGKIIYDKNKCIKCKLCEKVCPVKDTISTDNCFTINFSSCIFCGNCVENCPKNALEFTQEFELANKDKNKLIFKEDIK